MPYPRYRAEPVLFEPRLDRTMLELRERGLSYAAISTVLDLYEGVDVTLWQVSSRLKELGSPTNPNKTRPKS